MRDFGRYHFKEIKDEEKIIDVYHRHWFDIFLQITTIFFLTLLIFVGFFVFPEIFPDLKEREIYAAFLFVQSFFAVFIWMYAFFVWIDYYFDIWIVTDKRVVNIIQKGLFDRRVSELELERIQDVTTEVKGIIQTFLNYGDVYVQTAAEKERFIFHNVPDPYAIKDLIMTMRKKNEINEANELGEIIEEKIREGLS